MAAYIGRRLLTMVPLLFAVSILSFAIIQLPPGDYLSARIAQLKLQGTPASEEQIDSLRKRYGLDEPFHVQYVTWVGGMLRGDLGMSFIHKRPVSELIGERLILTVVLSLCSIILAYVIAIPIGIYSATHQYSPGDYLFTLMGFVGISIPQFFWPWC